MAERWQLSPGWPGLQNNRRDEVRRICFPPLDQSGPPSILTCPLPLEKPLLLHHSTAPPISYHPLYGAARLKVIISTLYFNQ